MAADASTYAALLVNTNYGIDRVIWRASPTYSVPLAGGISSYTEYTIPHGLPCIPLVLGTYSDDNFVTSYDLGTGPYGSLPTYGFSSFTMLAHAWADATNVTIRVISHNTARTITFHLVGLWGENFPTDTTNDLDVPTLQDNYLLTTDNAYFNSWVSTTATITTNGLGTYVNQAFVSGLDEPMTMMTWLYEDGKVSYGNTMNTITTSGVTVVALTRPDYFQISVSDTIIKSVQVHFMGYIDAPS